MFVFAMHGSHHSFIFYLYLNKVKKLYGWSLNFAKTKKWMVTKDHIYNNAFVCASSLGAVPMFCYGRHCEKQTKCLDKM